MDDLGKGLGPALVSSWVRPLGRWDRTKTAANGPATSVTVWKTSLLSTASRRGLIEFSCQKVMFENWEVKGPSRGFGADLDHWSYIRAAILRRSQGSLRGSLLV